MSKVGMDDEPPAISQTSTRTSEKQSQEDDTVSGCPFCTIVSNFPPISPLSDYSNSTNAWDPEKLAPPAYVLLSTEDVIAFMDIAPLVRGHVLVAPRKHRIKIGDLSPNEMAEIGRILPLIARGVIRAALPDIPHDEADYNVVQNNGPGAAQVIPHVHFHIVPRPPLNYSPPSPTTIKSLQSSPLDYVSSVRPSKYPPSKVNHKPPLYRSPSRESLDESSQQQRSKYPQTKLPTGSKRSYIQFGRGIRSELDEEDAAPLVEEMRKCVRQEWEKEFGSANKTDDEQRSRILGRTRSPEKL